MTDTEPIREGMPVYDAAGIWMGNVEARGLGRFLVRTGYFTKQRVVVEDDAVKSIHGASIRLSVTQQQALERHMRGEDVSPLEMQDPNEPR